MADAAPSPAPTPDPAVEDAVRRIYADLKALLARDDLPPGLRRNAIQALTPVWMMMGDLALDYEMLYDLGV
ncbi:MAG TPA: hypothetical protein VII06_11440 [Chloroflexota bacterium]|jgi:hypothetical protein